MYDSFADNSALAVAAGSSYTTGRLQLAAPRNAA